METIEASCLLLGVCITCIFHSIVDTVIAGEFNSLNPTLVAKFPSCCRGQWFKSLNGSAFVQNLQSSVLGINSMKLFLLLLSLKFKHDRNVIYFANFQFMFPSMSSVPVESQDLKDVVMCCTV